MSAFLIERLAYDFFFQRFSTSPFCAVKGGSQYPQSAVHWDHIGGEP